MSFEFSRFQSLFASVAGALVFATLFVSAAVGPAGSLLA